MALVFYSSREGFDEPPELAQKEEASGRQVGEFVRLAKNPARHSDLAAVWNVRFGSLADISPSEVGMSALPLKADIMLGTGDTPAPLRVH